MHSVLNILGLCNSVMTMFIHYDGWWLVLQCKTYYVIVVIGKVNSGATVM